MPQAVPAVITVDVEDWYHVCGTNEVNAYQEAGRVEYATGLLLQLLKRCGVSATFFMLGTVMKQHPDLAPLIVQHGHELASHGWSHQLVPELGPQRFREELEQTAALMQAQTGVRPYGFRAPRWSLCRCRTPWAFDQLAALGYRYDSSLTPLAMIGDPTGPREPHLINTASGAVWELPPLVTGTWFGNLPTGGGWGFRFFPYWLIRQTVQQYIAAGRPAVLFVHPRELDPQGPRLHIGMFRGFVTYGSRSSSAERLNRLLQQYRCTTMGALTASWQPVS